MLSFEAARAKILEVILERLGAPKTKALATETIDISRNPSEAVGRILAEDVIADRNYPPFNRSIRDGFALRAADTATPGARLRVIGESRAGVAFDGPVGEGECVRILTGAPVPKGANAVLMHEYTRMDGDFVVPERTAHAGQHYVLAGAESRVGEIVIPRGARLSYSELAMAAEVGRAQLQVSRRPRVAILSTGDELVGLTEKPGLFQIRNSNSISLAAQVEVARGEPILAGNARDDEAELRACIERALESDMLVMSGGVSAGKYDLVEQVLQDIGAEILFDAVAIRPGKPAVFAWCRGKPVFGLPGNPVSTMVTFELFVVPAIEAMSGHPPRPLPFFKAKLAHPVSEKGTVTHFLPARVSWPTGETGGDPKVEILLWEGSGDIGAVVRGNCFLVVHESRPELEAGEWVDVYPRRNVF
ncbi:MAG TPA: gephyrin-like molybdotransferase Glp [Candidatus Acidoferrum sp.]|jgi:molybdopterin molybdotransferase|nr:gephyrin-like molybdotransferase Glp [Candidatus Acidoferrum sp.]